MKKTMLFAILMFAAIFLGSLVADLAESRSAVYWLSKSYSFGVSTFDLDLKILVLTLGFQFRVNVAQILLVLAALISYPRVSSVLLAE